MKRKNNFYNLIAVFDKYLEVEKNLSRKTREAYCYDLQRFINYCGKISDTDPRQISVDSIQTDEIKGYMTYLQSEKKYKSTTLSRCLVSIRVFLDYCLMEKYIDASPAQFIHNPKLAKRLPIYLIESELKAILMAPDRSTVWGKRDFAILLLLGMTGIRRQELVGLNIESIDFVSKTIKVLGKGSKERLIPMNEIVENTLSEWVNAKPISGDYEAVFINQRGGKRLTGRAILDLVKKYLMLAGIPKDKISPHKLRHTFATLLHLNNVELVEIQKLLGHANIASTQIYTHTNVDRLRHAVNSLNSVMEEDISK